MRQIFRFSFERESHWMLAVCAVLPVIAILLFILVPGFARQWSSAAAPLPTLPIRLNLNGDRAVTAYALLGFRDEYIGHVAVEGDDTIERFYPNEHNVAERFGTVMRRLLHEQGLPEIVHEDVDSQGFTFFRSAAIADALDALYLDKRVPHEWHLDEAGHRHQVTRMFVGMPMFSNEGLPVKLAFLAGAFARYGHDGTFLFANAHHKAVVVAELLKDVGADDVRIETVTRTLPNANIVRFTAGAGLAAIIEREP